MQQKKQPEAPKREPWGLITAGLTLVRLIIDLHRH
jgi:hypothetical protein